MMMGLIVADRKTRLSQQDFYALFNVGKHQCPLVCYLSVIPLNLYIVSISTIFNEIGVYIFSPFEKHLNYHPPTTLLANISINRNTIHIV